MCLRIVRAASTRALAIPERVSARHSLRSSCNRDMKLSLGLMRINLASTLGGQVEYQEKNLIFKLNTHADRRKRLENST